MTTQAPKRFLLSLLIFLTCSVFTHAQSTSFTYQGKLTDANVAANGTYDMQFRLFDNPAAGQGTQQGMTITNPNVQATNGIFTTNLDFGSTVFAAGASVYLEVSMRLAGNVGGYTALAPRQQIASAPYSIQSLNATTATTAANAVQLGGVPANQFTQNSDSRLTDARSPTAGSGNYIQNGTTLQGATNFNISGNGGASIFDATTQYNIAGNQVLSVPGIANTFVGTNAGVANLPAGGYGTFVGDGAGQSNTSGFRNSFFGTSSGNKNTTGSNNAFFGATSGQFNTIGLRNAFFGDSAGSANSAGSYNSFYGYASGQANTTAINNSFFGQSSGSKNTTGQDNTFIGNGAGFNNLTTSSNTFVGSLAGFTNSTGASNSFFGFQAGNANTTGTGNTFIGISTGLTNTVGSNNLALGNGANFGANNLTFATAIGAGTIVSTSNTLVFGRAADTVQIPGSLNVSGTFGANIFNAVTQYNIGGNHVLSSAGTNNLFAGNGAGLANSTGAGNSFFGFNAGTVNSSGSFNSFFGSNAGAANTTAINNAFFGQAAGYKNTTGGNNTFLGNGAGLNNTTAIGNTFVGSLAGQGTSNGSNNTFMGVNAGTSNFGSSNNTFIGANVANSNLTGSGNTYIGANADGSILLSNATAIGQNAFAAQNNSIVLGGINGVNGAAADTFVGIGTNAPQTNLHIFDSIAGFSVSRYPLLIESNSFVVGLQLHSNAPNMGNHTWSIESQGGGTNTTGTLWFRDSAFGTNPFSITSAGSGNSSIYVDGTIALTLATGGHQAVCINTGTSGILSTCSSSLRYKKDVSSFKSGLSLLNKLNPITFRWKSDNSPDLGFGAEDIAKVEPLLVTHNAKGEVEGVKYDRITAVLVNSVKEQQAQIERQQKQIDIFAGQVTALRSMVAKTSGHRRRSAKHTGSFRK